MKRHDLAVIPGDGIGPEVTTEALKVMEAAATRFNFSLRTTEYSLGAERYLATGETLPDDTVKALRGHAAILFGAIGDPRVPPGILERGFLLALRTQLRHAVNLRPVRLYPGVDTPISGLTPDRCDIAIVRENTEGLYAGAGNTVRVGTRDVVATELSVNTSQAITDLVRYGFELARHRRRKLTLCHKKNVLTHAGGLWQGVVDEVAADYPDVDNDYVHVDAMCQYLPISPERFDVIVTDNLFGDIISDLGATLQGGLGTACSANINIDGSAPSMFEPVHGSAPDIAGSGAANPAAAILSGAMCLSALGEVEAAVACEAVVASVLAELPRRGEAQPGTAEIGDRMAAALSDSIREWSTSLGGRPTSIMSAMRSAAACALVGDRPKL